MILLTHGYFIAEDDKEQQIMKPYPPLGLLYISAFLNQNKINNTIFDSTFSTKKELKEFLLKNKPKIIALYTNIVTKLNVLEFIQFIRVNPDLKDTKIILGGPDITSNIENYLNTSADYLVIGEGEQTLLDLVNSIQNNTDFSEIQGIAYKKEKEIIKTAPRVKIKDLAELPLPNREGIVLENYLETWKKFHGSSTISVSTQRGCPYTCKWCSTAVYGQSYRRRPAKKVIEELKFLKERYNPDSIWFVDDVFTVSHKWIKEFHQETQKQNCIIPFECITRAERLNDEVLQLLKEAGCVKIWIGAESGSQRIIDKMDRRVDVNVVRETIQKTNKVGIETGTFIMVGYPDETEEDINETINHLKIANPTQFTITVAYPIKGTSLYNEVESEISTDLDWNTSTDRDINFTRTYSRKYYDYAVKRIVNEVNFHKILLNKPNKYIIPALKLKTKSILAYCAMKYYKNS